MTEAPISDALLMRAVAAGERSSLETLMRRHAPGVLTMIQRCIGDRHRSEDLFQEVFLSVWIKRRQYQYPRPFRPWLYRIALNRCRLYFRELGQDRTELADHLPTSAELTAQEQAMQGETAAIVAAAVGQLPPSQRVVVVLRIWNGLSYAEIAEIAQREEATIRSHMFHALRSLRTHLEPRLK